MYLPSPLSLPFEETPQSAVRVGAILGFDEEDLALSSTLATRFLSLVADLEISTVDLTPTLPSCADQCFWRTDLHLSVRGHEVVGELLADRIQALPGAARNRRKAR